MHTTCYSHYLADKEPSIGPLATAASIAAERLCDDVMAFHSTVEASRPRLGFDIDGVVVKVGWYSAV